MNYIQGKDCLFQVDLGEGYINFACAKNFALDLETEEKEITFVTDGNWKDYDYKSLSYTIQLDSVLVIQDGVNPSAFDALEYQTGFIEIKYRMLFEQGNLVKVITGLAIVKKSSFTATANQLADSSITLLGKGSFTNENALPSLVNLRLRMSGNDSVAALAKFRLINIDGEIIFQTDTIPQASGGNLANPFDITVQVPKGNWYYFWQVDAESFGNTFNLDAPPTKSSGFENGINNESSFPSQLYDFNADRNATFTIGVATPPPTCVAPSIIGSPILPDGKEFTDYFYAFNVSGTEPFNISNITKPAWLSITISGSTITFSGKPRDTDVGTSIPISFDINNACGTTSFSETMNVNSNPTFVAINYTFTCPAGFGNNFRMFVNGLPLITPLTASGSGSTAVNPGDTIEVQVTRVGHTKHLVVVDSVSGTICDNTTGSTTQAFTWVAVSGHTYTITSTIS